MKKPQILLIEDTESVREVLSRQLEALGVRVMAVADGFRAMEFLKLAVFDLIITDLELPGHRGTDIATFAHAKHIKTVLLTGDMHAKDSKEVINSHFDSILIKPVSLETLRDLLQKYGFLADDIRRSFDTHPDLADDTGTIDLDMVRQNMGRIDGVVLKMLSRFPDTMRIHVATLAEAVLKKEYSEVDMIAHSLKGAAYSAGAVRLGEMCSQIQRAASQKDIRLSALSEIIAEFGNVETVIRKLSS